MEYNCRILCTMSVSCEVDGEKYTINENDVLHVQSQSIDKQKWFVFIPSISKYDWIEKYHFDFLIDKNVTYPKYFGEFKLPVISENIHSYTCIQPSGYVTWVSKLDAVTVQDYNEAQKINCDEIRFR
ncbi:hypothetical protein [Paenibacillus sp. LK1]|uniref:hypothetical protein n=1 Tax=Paenibacillus sp. LK1 TaxID=2053014 RepID=UPI000C19B11D|nr:hypothetical protein [Paenibacillus sp. LK1]PIH59130.1 hypothetical protein CS562_14420 [Paenibacillus sp. LK1]